MATNTKLVMVIDLARCTGCESCTVACQAENSIPLDGRSWTPVYQYEVEGSGTNLKKYSLPRPCMHCDNAPCVQVCPVEATRKEDNGIVSIDYDRCIGCRYCMVACPYNARVFNWGDNTAKIYDNPLVPVRPRGIVEKCTFCSHKTVDSTTGEATGILPECVLTCIGGARMFGNLEGDNGNDQMIQRILGTRNDVFQLKEELGTHPSVFYLPP